MKISSPNYHNNSYASVHTPTASHVFDLNSPPRLPGPFEPNAMYDCEAPMSVGGGGGGPPSVGSTPEKAELMDISMGPSENGDLEALQDGQPDAVKFSCEVCSRKYATKLTLEKHLRTHDLFLCIVCDKVSDCFLF